MRPFFLSSERLEFTTWLADHLPQATSLWGDPEVTRFLGGAWSPEQIRTRLFYEIASHQEWGAQYWLLIQRDTRELVGCCGFHMRDPPNGVWELGCHLRRAFWSKGLGREAASAALDYGFHSLGFKAVFAGHHPLNTPSQDLLQDLGFQYTHDEFHAPSQLFEPCYLLKRGT